MAPLRFRSTLIRPTGVGTWTFASIPAGVIQAGALRPRQRVKGSIDGVPFASSLMPRGGGSLFVVVNSDVREKIGKSAGSAVRFELTLDTSPRVIEVPPALTKALRGDTKAQAAFQGLAPSHRKAYATWIASAKQPETVVRRVEKALQMLRRGETLT